MKRKRKPPPPPAASSSSDEMAPPGPPVARPRPELTDEQKRTARKRRKVLRQRRAARALLAVGEPKAKRPPNAQAVMFTDATVLAQELRKENPNVKWAQHVKAGYAAVKERQLAGGE